MFAEHEKTNPKCTIHPLTLSQSWEHFCPKGDLISCRDFQKAVCVLRPYWRYHPYCDIRSLYKLSLIRTIKSLTAKALLVIYELLCFGPGTNCYLSSVGPTGLKLLWEKGQWVIVHTTGLPQVMFYQIQAPDWPKPLHTHWLCTLTGQSKIQDVKRNHWKCTLWF